MIIVCLVRFFFPDCFHVLFQTVVPGRLGMKLRASFVSYLLNVECVWICLKQGTGAVVLAFSSRARIFGECSTIHSLPALKKKKEKKKKERLARAH